jgi:hypothetical protein
MYDEADKAAFVVAADSSGKDFPKDVFTLPSTRVMVAERGSEVLMYMPQFLSMTMGSLIPKRQLTDREMAEAQHQLLACAYTRAHSEGFADIFASSNDIRTRKFCIRHGATPWADALRLEIR